jgi:hypothetical protein
MVPTRKFTAALLLGASFLITACSDLPTAPEPVVEEPSYGLLGDLLGALTGGGSNTQVSVLERDRPLAEDEVASRVIGYYGGTIHLPEAGLTVTFPWGALRSSTRITVTAPAGNLVGYHFEPHGLRFRRDVTVVQDLRGTEADLLGLGLGVSLNLQAAYFEGELKPEVTALESITLWLLRILGVFKIDHFSGYVIATM